MSKLKTIAIERIKRLPDDINIEDIMYEIIFIGQVIEGLQNSQDGHVITTEELLARVNSW